MTLHHVEVTRRECETKSVLLRCLFCSRNISSQKLPPFYDVAYLLLHKYTFPYVQSCLDKERRLCPWGCVHVWFVVHVSVFYINYNLNANEESRIKQPKYLLNNQYYYKKKKKLMTRVITQGRVTNRKYNITALKTYFIFLKRDSNLCQENILFKINFELMQITWYFSKKKKKIFTVNR